MPRSDEEMREAYEKQKAYDARTGSQHPVSGSYEEFMKGGKKKSPKPTPAPAPKPPEGKKTLGSRLLAGAKDFVAGMQSPPSRGRSRGGSRSRSAGRAVGRLRQNMAANASRMTMADFIGTPQLPAFFDTPPMFGGGGPVEPPAPRRKKGKKKKQRLAPEPEDRPWEAGYIPPGLRHLF
jgi:hypothetical protein